MGNLGTSLHPGEQPTRRVGLQRLRTWLLSSWQPASRTGSHKQDKPGQFPTDMATLSGASHLLETAANSQQFTATRPTAPLAPLRVVRLVDANCTSHSAGRMMISGRFSDVCAELDRLSQQVAA